MHTYTTWSAHVRKCPTLTVLLSGALFLLHEVHEVGKIWISLQQSSEGGEREVQSKRGEEGKEACCTSPRPYRDATRFCPLPTTVKIPPPALLQQQLQKGYRLCINHYPRGGPRRRPARLCHESIVRVSVHQQKNSRYAAGQCTALSAMREKHPFCHKR